MAGQNPFGHRGNLKIEIKTTPRESLELLQKLGSDDTFRQRFQEDPHGVLRRHGIHIPAELLSSPITLPAKEDVQNALLSLERDRTVPPDGPGFFFFVLGSAAFVGFFFPSGPHHSVKDEVSE